jgi:hypothetical protein
MIGNHVLEVHLEAEGFMERSYLSKFFFLGPYSLSSEEVGREKEKIIIHHMGLSRELQLLDPRSQSP